MTRILGTGNLRLGAVLFPKNANRIRIGGYLAVGLLGTLLGVAIASSEPPPMNVGPAPASAATPPCYWQTERVWTGFTWSYQRVRVCY